METIVIGGSDLVASRIGFGCWQLGGYGWQNIEQQEIEKAIHRALELGINFFDTADIYGLGQSESLLAEAIAGHYLGKSAIIATKFGVRKGENGTYYDNSKEWLEQALENSLKRLKRDTIDLYQIHWHDGKREISDVMEDLEKYRKQGKIRWYGISNIPLSLIDTKLRPEGLVSFSMEYSLIQRKHEPEIINETMQAIHTLHGGKNLTFIAWGALAQGLLSGKYNRHSVFADNDIRSREHSVFSEKHWDYNEPILCKLHQISLENNKNMSQVALRFVLDSIPSSMVLTGIKNTIQLNENQGTLGWNLAEKDIKALKKISDKILTLRRQTKIRSYFSLFLKWAERIRSGSG